MPVPKGQISVFYYKSRINSFNFTVSDLHAKDVECYFCNEIEGKRGATEIGTCILNYFEKITQNKPEPVDVIFYSDNCCGQQKNLYLLSDRRGRHDNHKIVLDDAMKQSVCDHVRAFAPVESHYIRKNSQKLYLQGDLSIAKMFKLYLEWFDPEKHTFKATKVRQYRDIVNSSFNLAFHIPKKYQCNECHVFRLKRIQRTKKKKLLNNTRLITILREHTMLCGYNLITRSGRCCGFHVSVAHQQCLLLRTQMALQLSGVRRPHHSSVDCVEVVTAS